MNARQLKESDPSSVRRDLQTRYDSYMSGRRMILGMFLNGVTIENMGSDAASRDRAYDEIAERWPNKTKRLIKAIAREQLFEEYCRENHAFHKDGLFTEFAKRDNLRPESGIMYLSGLGRNACIASVLFADEDGQKRRVDDLIGRPKSLVKVFKDSTLSLGLLIDPDYGVGGISGPTPEVFDFRDGSEMLAVQTMTLEVA